MTKRRGSVSSEGLLGLPRWGEGSPALTSFKLIHLKSCSLCVPQLKNFGRPLQSSHFLEPHGGGEHCGFTASFSDHTLGVGDPGGLTRGKRRLPTQLCRGQGRGTEPQETGNEAPTQTSEGPLEGRAGSFRINLI